MKIKNKLIHLLGGYTQKEYLESFNPKKFVSPIKRYEAPISTLTASLRVNTAYIPIPDNQMREELAVRLAMQMLNEGYINFITENADFQTSTNPPVLRAYVSVVRRNPV